MVDIDMAILFRIPVDDRDKEERGGYNFPADANRDSSEDVDG